MSTGTAVAYNDEVDYNNRQNNKKRRYLEIRKQVKLKNFDLSLFGFCTLEPHEINNAYFEILGEDICKKLIEQAHKDGEIDKKKRRKQNARRQSATTNVGRSHTVT